MTLRLGCSSAAALVAAMVCFPASAQDGPRQPKPKVERSTSAQRAPTPAPEQPASEEDAAEGEGADLDAPTQDAEVAESGPEDTTPPDQEAADEDTGEVEEDGAEEDDEISPDSKPTKAPPKAREKKRVPASSWAARYMPYELDYYDGMTVPDGYMKVDKTRTGLIIAGAITFGVSYLAAAAAAVAQDDEEQSACGGHTSHHGGEGYTCILRDNDDYTPLYIPLAGPFIAMGTMENQNGAVRSLLLIDGVAQVGGAAMFIAGLVAKKTILVRTKHATLGVAPGPGTMMLHGSF